LNDFVFLQRMYDAGGGAFFDVLAMQGYGLWSGPTDRRMRPRVLNFSRPLYLREIMVENGDQDKPIWITEMNWNAPPSDLPNKQFGFVTPEQQARYAVLAYQRAQEEWPWVGVVNFWFFKRATDAEADQAMYYFRLVDPDFTPMPVYDALKSHFSEPATLYPGVHQENHWALAYDGPWEARTEAGADLGAVRFVPGFAEAMDADGSAAELAFRFDGTDLWLKPGPSVQGSLHYSLDGGPETPARFEAGQPVQLARGLGRGPHTVTIRPGSEPLSVDSLTVQQRFRSGIWLLAGGALVLTALIVALVWNWLARRRRWYERGRLG
jgi:hypothetical protein